MPERLQQLTAWLATLGVPADADIRPASSDASFRRYFRVSYHGVSRIVMDAPPDKEDCRPFMTVAAALQRLGLNVPQVLAANLEHGFLWLTDLGTCQYLNALTTATVADLYRDAMAALVQLAQADSSWGASFLPRYDQALLHREMGLFREWFLGIHLGIVLTADEEDVLQTAFDHLAANALAQTQVWVHRDYHSRNLMVTHPHNPGILDFQDAVIGPVTYDLVSLLRDCYITWPPSQVDAWVRAHHARLTAEGVLAGVSADEFLHHFDLMGVQRHLKAIGIFARLKHRDGKAAYLQDIPRTLGYVQAMCERHQALAALGALLQRHVISERVLDTQGR